MNPIRRLRKAQGWTQQDLAQKVGCSRSLISMLETGQTMPTFSMLQVLSRQFGVSIASFITEFEPSPSAKNSAAQG